MSKHRMETRRHMAVGPTSPRHKSVVSRSYTKLVRIFLALMLGLMFLAAPSANASTRYTIHRGDTLSSIAVRFHTTVRALVRANHISNPNRIYAGRSLIIPTGTHRSRPGVPLLLQGPHGQLNAPVHPFVVTQWYSYRHQGIDFAAPYGTPIHALVSGRVEYVAYWNYSYGHHLEIRHIGGETMYAHMGSVYVHPGQYVVRGQVIGRVGSTGHSTGPHVHLQLHNRYDRAINPYYWIF